MLIREQYLLTAIYQARSQPGILMRLPKNWHFRRGFKVLARAGQQDQAGAAADDIRQPRGHNWRQISTDSKRE